MSPDSPSLPTTRRPGRPDPQVIVLFGATGDLARRKLLPGLFHLAAAGLLPERYRIVGTARSKRFSEAGFKEYAHDAVAEFATVQPTGDPWRGFEDALSFAAADRSDPAPLVSAVRAAEKELGGRPQQLVPPATSPGDFQPTNRGLGGARPAGGARGMILKALGPDLASAPAQNDS